MQRHEHGINTVKIFKQTPVNIWQFKQFITALSHSIVMHKTEMDTAHDFIQSTKLCQILLTHSSDYGTELRLKPPL